MDNGTRVETAALYNLTDNTYTPFHITESPLCSGHVLTHDGTAFVVGGVSLLLLSHRLLLAASQICVQGMGLQRCLHLPFVVLASVHMGRDKAF